MRELLHQPKQDMPEAAGLRLQRQMILDIDICRSARELTRFYA